LEKLLYFVLVAVSNKDGASFYSDARLAELLDIRFPHELEAARNELVARDLIAYAGGIYQVCLPGAARVLLLILTRNPPQFVDLPYRYNHPEGVDGAKIAAL
jgi:hypothetical protein